MESTKEVLVRRSNNLFLPFSGDTRYGIGKDKAFSSDPTLFATIMSDGNIHIHGTKSVEDSGYILIGGLTQNLILKAGSTYNLSVSSTAHTQFILQSDQSGTRTNIMQVNPTFTNGLTKTMTEDTVITHVFMNISGATPINIGDTIDEYVNPMLVEQSARMDYEPYYREYESTKEILVRRSNNLFLPFSSIPSFAIGVDHKFEYDPTLFCTIEENGNIHIHGTKSVRDSGFVLCRLFTAPLTLKAGKTYSYKYNNTYGNCSLQSNVSGTRVSVLGNGTRKVTPTTDTPITHVYVDTFAINKEENIGKEYDFYINPMVVEGDTAQDYEPYYREYEATSMQINDFYPTGYVVNSKGIAVMNLVDFSNSVYNQFLLENGNTFSNDVWAYTPDYAQCEGNAQYYIGCLDLIPNNNTLRQYSIYFYDENKQIIPNSATGAWGHTNQDFKVEKTSPSNAKYMRIRFDRFGDKAENPYPKFLYVYKDPTA